MLSEGTENQSWSPLTLPLIPLHSSSNHSLGSDVRVWVWVKGQKTAEIFKMFKYVITSVPFRGITVLKLFLKLLLVHY